MLIPQECHKPAYQIDAPVVQQAFIPITHVAKMQKSFGTKHHEEKGHKKKRKFRYILDDESELSEEAYAEETNTVTFVALLQGLSEAY